MKRAERFGINLGFLLHHAVFDSPFDRRARRPTLYTINNAQK